MICPLESSRNPGLLVEFSAGRVDGSAGAALRHHIASCHECAAFCRAQEAVWTALDAFEPPPLSPGFHRRLSDRIEEENRTGFWSRVFPWLGGLRPAAPLAIASVLALAVLLLQAPQQAELRQQTAAVDPVDPDNLEQAVNDLDMIRQLSLPLDVDAAQPM